MPLQIEEPRTRRWSRDEFYRMMDLGWFLGQNVELMRGEILEMPNQKSGHYAAIDQAAECLLRVLGPGVWIRTQAPLALEGDTEPNPDVSVVVGSRSNYLDQHPTTALLVIEVSDSTLRYDRKAKAGIYAGAGIADYWIINLPDRQIEVYRQPIPDPTGELDFVYHDVRLAKSSEVLNLVAFPEIRIQVAELLP